MYELGSSFFEAILQRKINTLQSKFATMNAQDFNKYILIDFQIHSIFNVHLFLYIQVSRMSSSRLTTTAKDNRQNDYLIKNCS